MRVSIFRTSVLALTAAAGFAQTASQARFDVSSAKAVEHTDGGPYGPENIAANPGSLNMRNVRLRSCIKWAYGVKDYQIAGPEWLGSPGYMAVNRYDIIAKAADGTPVSELRTMLQTLLADRFKLEIHREMRDVPSYGLTLAKVGPRLQASKSPDGDTSIDTPNNTLSIKSMSMAQFAEFLSALMHGPVVDETKLPGKFDLSVEDEPSPNPMDQQYGFLSALRDQLGLKLEARKSRLEVLVVDRMERVPTEN